MSESRDFSSDQHRPVFHYLPPANWMNDPNGLIQWRGKYHLFYQYNPNGAFWGTMHWGHAMSEDLVHWEHMPIALAPDPDGPDADGCFSGCAVNVSGVATFMYTGVRGDLQLPCVATSHDDDLATWTKHPGNPVIPAPPSELDTTIFRDHSVWKEQDQWHQVIGSGVKGLGGAALMYRSPDFLNWDFVGSLLELDTKSEGSGDGATGWECPDFFSIDGQHGLIVCAWDHKPISVRYMTGVYADGRFDPRHEGIVDPGSSFYAPQSFTDESGRRVMFGWLKESRSVEAQMAAGWSGAMSLPRILTILADGSLGTTPAPEIQKLRQQHIGLGPEQITPGEDLPLGDISGSQMEMLLSFEPGSTQKVEIEVLRSGDGSERTIIGYDPVDNFLSVDTRQSSHADSVERDLLSIDTTNVGDGPVQVRVFVDHSIVEVFINDIMCITARSYPTLPDSHGVRIITDNRSYHEAIHNIDLWAMNSM